MTPLLAIEASNARGGPAAPAGEDAAPKGDGAFAELVDAPENTPENADEPAAQPTQEDLPATEDVTVDLNPESIAVPSEVPELPKQVAIAQDATDPAAAGTKTGEPATETARLVPEVDAESDEKPADAKVVTRPEKGKPTAPSAAQAIVEGRMPRPQTGDALQTAPARVVPTAAEPEPEVSEAELSETQKDARVSAPTTPAPTGRTSATPIATATPAVTATVELKPEREIDRHLPSMDQTQQPTETVKPVNPTPAVASNTPVLAAAPTILLDLQKQAANQAEAEAEVLTALGAGERAGSSGAQTVSVTASAITPQTGQQVAQQIAIAVTQQGGRATEISLNPEELGKVRLSMTANENTITLNLVAERPETTDLLRRNIETLAQEFRALGYDDINFSFGGDGAAQTDADETPGQGAPDVEFADDNTTLTTQQHATSGLDLRL